MGGELRLLVLLGCNAALLVGGVLPNLREVAALREREGALLLAKARARHSSAQRSGVSTSTDEVVSAALEAAEARLTRKLGLPALTARLRALTTSAGLTLVRVEYHTRRERGRVYAELEADLMAQGAYRGIKALLWGLEGCETPMAVRSIAVLDTEQPGSTARTVRLTVGTYLLP